MTSSLKNIKPNAAGIDVGSRSHFVAVPADRDEQSVREFGFFTEDLYRLADWLLQCKIETVAFEATGSYWIPLYDILIEKGFEVCLTNARHIKNVSGRKTDVLDCQWIQQLHSFGLLKPSFIPDRITTQLRHFVRHRDGLIRQTAKQIQFMQKALIEMNLQLQNVVSDIAGDTGMRIIRALCAGEKNPKKLAEYRDPRCKNSKETIERSLTGHYKEEILFSLKQAVETYDHVQRQIDECNERISSLTKQFDDHSKGEPPLIERKREAKKNNLGFDLQGDLWRMLGVNLLEIPGVNIKTALTVISEIGPSVDSWVSSKHFAAWLGLCPNNRISGGKRISGRTKHGANRIKRALCLAAVTLERSTTALGAFFRRMKARLGAPKAITAVAHKLAVVLYHLIKTRTRYVERGSLYFEKEYKEKAERRLKRMAARLGYELIQKDHDPKAEIVRV